MQGYSAIDTLTEIIWEDLEEIGIQKLGHQKKIMLAIDRLKRIQNVTRRLSSMDRRGSQEMLEPPSSYPTPKWLSQGESRGPQSPAQHSPHPQSPAQHSPLPHSPAVASPRPLHPGHRQYGESVVITTGGKPRKSLSGENLCLAASELKTFQQPKDEEVVHLRQNKSVYQPDVVAIQVSNVTHSQIRGAFLSCSSSIYSCYLYDFRLIGIVVEQEDQETVHTRVRPAHQSATKVFTARCTALVRRVTANTRPPTIRVDSPRTRRTAPPSNAPQPKSAQGSHLSQSPWRR